jgi:hypothetical protein
MGSFCQKALFGRLIDGKNVISLFHNCSYTNKSGVKKQWFGWEFVLETHTKVWATRPNVICASNVIPVYAGIQV